MGVHNQECLANMLIDDTGFRAQVVYLILSKDTKEALELLSRCYKIGKPKLVIGMPKRYSKNPACYVAKNQTIHVAQREFLWSPQIILHEFYHHLRRLINNHGGNEKYADKFAKNYLKAYKDKMKK
jgi:hypothetical protein